MKAERLEILYLGNKQGEFGAVISYMEFITPYFEEFATVRSASGKRNYLLRLTEWCQKVLWHGRNADWILLDVYSGKQFYGVLCVVTLLKVMGLKYSCVLRGGNLPSRLKKNPGISKYVFGGADYLIAPSQFLKDSFEKVGYQCIVIPNAVGNNFNGIRKSIGPTPRLLCVRGIRQVYNPLLAVKVLKELKADFPDAYLCMTGTKEDALLEEVLDYVSKNSLTDSFEFKGVLTKDEWFNLSHDYSIYLSTTNFDNTPVSMIEAMNLGLLIVSTNVGGVPYLVNDGVNALLFEKGNLKEAVSKIEMALEKKELFTKLVNNSMELGESYRVDRVIQTWRDFFYSPHTF